VTSTSTAGGRKTPKSEHSRFKAQQLLTTGASSPSSPPYTATTVSGACARRGEQNTTEQPAPTHRLLGALRSRDSWTLTNLSHKSTYLMWAVSLPEAAWGASYGSMEVPGLMPARMVDSTEMHQINRQDGPDASPQLALGCTPC
jgi:hypothetical protein